jgi:hypothetical protein
MTAVDPVWAIALQQPAAGPSVAVPFGMVAGLPTSASALPDSDAAALPPLRYSDRGWIGEPGDPDAPNEAWPARIIEAPAFRRAIPIYPTEGRRSEINGGEILLANGDGALDNLASDWRLAGRAVEVLRGPYRSPLRAARAEFETVATFRVARLAQGTAKLRLPLGSAAAELTMAVSATYTGTGGAEGTSSMAGQDKPVRLGIHYNVTPVLVAPGLLAYHLHDGPIAAVLAVRGRGDPFTFAGDHATWAGFAAAVVAGGTYVTCLALGFIRLGSSTSMLTVDFRGSAPGDVGYIGTAAGMAERLLRIYGGITPDRATVAAFSGWPTGEARLDATGLSVAEAMERLAAGVGGWWGADIWGRFLGSVLARPEDTQPTVVLERWMLAGAPEESEAALPPWYRVRAAYRFLGTIQTGEDIAPAVPEATRKLYAQPYSVSTDFRQSVQSAYPGAVDGPLLETAFDLEADATAFAARQMALFGVPRRQWQVTIRSDQAWRFWPLMQPGRTVRLAWPNIAALRDGKSLILRGISARGDRLTWDLWG